MELDHVEIEARSKRIHTARGTDINTINEKIFDNPGFVNQLHSLITVTLIAAGDQLDEQKGWRDLWEKLKGQLRTKCMEATHTD